jgi:acetyl-CoA synthetase
MMEPNNPLIRRWRDAARNDYEAFWARAADQVNWFRKWDRVLEWEPPTFKWFSGGRTNLSYNCLDLQIARGRAGHAALIAEHENGQRRVFTYAHLLEGVRDIAAALRALGVKRGDRVAIYMPTAPEAIMAMLAVSRIGAMHLVVFAGFGSGALAERCRLANAKVLLAADHTMRKGKPVDLWKIVKEAVTQRDSPVEKVVLLTDGASPSDLNPRRDILWDDFIAGGRGFSSEHEIMEANEPAFVLATSGTTATPKLAVHSHGAYQVGIRSTAAWCFGLRPDDVWWSTSDIGWIVGHSHIVYAPLLFGCTTIAYEGAIDHPTPSTFYRIAAQNHVSAIFTAPTAVRMLMRYGLEPARAYNLEAIERVFCAGESLNAPAWRWLQHEVFSDRVPVIDHWWQTETGGPVVGNPYGISLLPIKPGSAGVALPGFEVEIRDLEGNRCAPGEKGIVVITRPFPGLTPTIWNDPERYARDYWSRIPRVYFTGDAAHIDEDGYIWFGGRADEIIKIAGHRIGTAEVETAFLLHPAVAEAGVTARPDELRGEIISAFVALKPGYEASTKLETEIRSTVRDALGPVAVIGEINFVAMLPKTRSGKIMRRVLKAVILGKDPGDISTIEDEGSVEEIREAWAQMRGEVGR